MAVDNVNHQIFLQPALDCLIDSDSKFEDPENHYIGHNNLSTVEIWSYSEEEWPDFIHKDILPEDLQVWVDQETPMKEGKKPVASLKMMVGTMQDVWSVPRPRGELNKLRESMRHLSQKFSLPKSYLTEDTILSERFLSYDGILEPNNIDSYHAGFGESALAWSFNRETNASLAVFTISADGHHFTHRFVKSLEKSRILVDQALFLPYVMTVFVVTRFSPGMCQRGRSGRQLQYGIEDCLENQDDPKAYAALISKFDGKAYSLASTTYYQGVFEIVRQLVKHFLSREEVPSNNIKIAVQSFSSRKADFLKACLRNLDQRAVARIVGADKCQQRSEQ